MTARRSATALALALAVVLGLGLALALPWGGAGAAHAQPGAAPARPGRPVPVQVVDPGTQGGAHVEAAPAAAPDGSAGAADAPRDRDRTESSGKGMALLFWVFAIGTVGGALFVLTRRNLIAAVMGMVGSFFAVAGLYMMLYASFLAIIQVLVYAGAIMVLFVFVVMVLNRPEDEPWGLTGLPGKALAGLAMAYLTFRLGQTLWNVKPPDAALAAPGAEQVFRKVEAGKPVYEAVDWGSTKAVGSNLFTEYVFPFEAVSILLLVAVVGAIAIARPLRDDDEDATFADGAES